MMLSICLSVIIILIRIHTDASPFYYCSSTDPCAAANSTALYEQFARSENCQYDQSIGFCDRYIDPGWYRVDNEMLDYCPKLLSCGTLYPIWLNDSLPLETDGIVTLSACKVGFNDCCVKQYKIQVKNCSSYHAYCLGALDGCPERYCFGVNGSCYVPTTATKVATTEVVAKPTTTKCDEGQSQPCDRKKEKDPLSVLNKLLLAVVVVFFLLSIFLIGYLCRLTKVCRKQNASSPQPQYDSTTSISNSKPTLRNESPPPPYDFVGKDDNKGVDSLKMYFGPKYS